MCCHTDLRCDQNLSNIDHGHAKYHGNISTVGTMAWYVCDKYHNIYNASKRHSYCMEGNKWTPKEPVCKSTNSSYSFLFMHATYYASLHNKR